MFQLILRIFLSKKRKKNCCLKKKFENNFVTGALPSGPRGRFWIAQLLGQKENLDTLERRGRGGGRGSACRCVGQGILTDFVSV